MGTELVYAAGALGIAAINSATGYYLIFRQYREEKRSGRVRSFGDYWEQGFRRFGELMSSQWL
jgi:hypothetical protein